ncbi:920021cf-8b7b-4732-ba84-2935a329106d [Thermothielavioides terrestris]|uniref:920021cf-8b7b-4732-ba84-2935a329106d n=1 Tax=Thermothielavioides terrestris TaxID=2587410 RepID=A0A446BW85_9PEZI|nr:920021cf-8b7b-4732-ba84-2935a329106d [Thermothielavioides terrestris]
MASSFCSLAGHCLAGVLIHSPRNLEFVFKNEGLFTKGEFVKRRSWDLFGNGIINADGDLWKRQRKAGTAFLNNANLRVLTEVALPQYLAESVQDLQSSIGNGPVDLQHVFHEITTKLMAKMAYNMEMHADDDFSQSFDFASGATAERFQNPLWAVTELFTGSKFRKSIAVVKDFGRRIVASAVHDRSGQKAGVKAPNTPHDDDDGDSKLNQISGTLIQSLLDAIDNEDTVADAALTYLSAGRDTTGQALTWTFYLLLQHPSAVSEIRREVQHLLAQQQPPRPDDADPEHQTPNPTLFTPLSVPYTMAVFHETLRLYPPIPFEIRQCQADTTLPDGTFLPRHAVLVWCLWAMHRSRLTWGADADAFRPERFLEQQEQQHGGGEGDDEGGGAKPRFVLGKSVSEFPVFYGGARACLGRKMAELIAAQVIPVMVWLFEFEPAFEGERVSKTSLTLPMEGGLPVRVRRRVGDVRSN